MSYKNQILYKITKLETFVKTGIYISKTLRYIRNLAIASIKYNKNNLFFIFMYICTSSLKKFFCHFMGYVGQ